MILRFEQWIDGQQYREDFVGDLARVLNMQNAKLKSSRNKLDEHKSWAEIVVKIAEPGYVNVFNEAWQEFLLAKEAAKDTPD